MGRGPGILNEGSRVSLVDRNEVLLSELELDDFSGRLAAQVCDVTSHDACLVIVDSAQSQYGPIDVFIYAVGINICKSIEDITLNEWDSVMEVNLRSYFWLAQIIGAKMKESGGGKIVFLSSVSGLLTHPHHGVYAASKDAMN